MLFSILVSGGLTALLLAADDLAADTAAAAQVQAARPVAIVEPLAAVQVLPAVYRGDDSPVAHAPGADGLLQQP